MDWSTMMPTCVLYFAVHRHPFVSWLVSDSLFDSFNCISAHCNSKFQSFLSASYLAEIRRMAPNNLWFNAVWLSFSFATQNCACHAPNFCVVLEHLKKRLRVVQISPYGRPRHTSQTWGSKLHWCPSFPVKALHVQLSSNRIHRHCGNMTRWTTECDVVSSLRDMATLRGETTRTLPLGGVSLIIYGRWCLTLGHCVYKSIEFQWTC